MPMTSPTPSVAPVARRFSPVVSLSQQHTDYLSLVQLSDLHLFDDSEQLYNGVNPAANLRALMSMINADFNQSDAILLTGDLLQQPSAEGYDRLFERFYQLGKPWIAVAGNHDVTVELDSHLPFYQRRHVAVSADERLLNCHRVSSEYWDILCLDSTVSGKVHGHFDEPTLAWLAHTLAEGDKPCIIISHHPMAQVNSAWIDQHWLTNSEDFWAVVSPFYQRLKAIFVGHVHQELQLVRHAIPLYTCPAASAQFKPFCDDYVIDDIPAGLRWITLYNNGTLATGVKRIDSM